MATEGHLEECERATPMELAERYAADEGMTVAEWEAASGEKIPDAEGIYIMLCAPGCPVMQTTIDRAQALARERGW